MSDSTETARRAMCAIINAVPSPRADLEATLHERVWDTDQLRADFEVEGFMAPFVVVKRKSDGARGSMMFQHSPRFYWGFVEDVR